MGINGQRVTGGILEQLDVKQGKDYKRNGEGKGREGKVALGLWRFPGCGDSAARARSGPRVPAARVRVFVRAPGPACVRERAPLGPAARVPRARAPSAPGAAPPSGGAVRALRSFTSRRAPPGALRQSRDKPRPCDRGSRVTESSGETEPCEVGAL